MDGDDFRHLRLPRAARKLDYKYPRDVRTGEFPRPPRDRVAHANKLADNLQASFEQHQARGLTDKDPVQLTYSLRLEALPLVQSLEKERSGIELLNAQVSGESIKAVVWVPPGKRRIVEAVFNRYQTEDTKKGRPKQQDLVENIDEVSLATEQDLWTDTTPFPAAEEELWWEVWLHHSEHSSTEEAWRAFLDELKALGFRGNARVVTFPDRIVGLVWGTARQWAQAHRPLLAVAELRKAKELATDYVDAGAAFQGETCRGVPGPVDPCRSQCSSSMHPG